MNSSTRFLRSLRLPSVPSALRRAAFATCAIAIAGVGCGPEDMLPIESESIVGRWSGEHAIDDFSFAEGRAVEIEELFVLREDGSMRADVIGYDDVTGCSVDYELRGTWSEDESMVAVEWTSIIGSLSGCDDEALDEEPTDVTVEERDAWLDDLTGEVSVEGDTLTIVYPTGESIDYARVTNPFAGRWSGESSVDDFDFADGREVALDEMFFVGPASALRGRFVGYDDTSGCTVDYDLSGEWLAVDASFDVNWTSILVTVAGCDDPSFDSPRTEVVADEGEIWNAELEGQWSIESDQLVIQNAAGGTLVYDGVR